MIERALRLVEDERLEPERASEVDRELSGGVALCGDSGEGAVELFGSSRAREGLQRVEAEAALVRVECRERRASADMGDPRPGGDLGGDVCDRAVGHAHEHELGAVLTQLDAPLREAGGDRGADTAPADDVHRFDHQKLQFRNGYRAPRRVASQERVKVSGTRAERQGGSRPLAAGGRLPLCLRRVRGAA